MEKHTRFIFLFILCTFTITGLPENAIAQCFQRFRSEGIAAYDTLNFESALNKFKAAQLCDDLPRRNDIETWIVKAQNGYIDAIQKARMDAESARDIARKNEMLAKEAKKETEKALELTHREALKAHALSVLFDDDPTRAAKIAGYLYLEDSAEFSLPMLKSYYRDYFYYQGELFAEPFYKILYQRPGLRIISITLPDDQNQLLFLPSGEKDIYTLNIQQEKVRPLSGHGDQALALAVAENGSLIASSSADRSVIIRGTTGEVISRIDNFPAPVTALQFWQNPEGRIYLVTGTRNGEVQIWHPDGNPLLRSPIRTRQSLHLMDLSANGKYLATASQGRDIRLWNVDFRKERLRKPRTITLESRPHTLLFYPDSDRLLTATYDKVQVYDPGSRRLSDLVGINWRLSVMFARLSRDAQSLLVGFADGTTGVFNAGTGKLLAELGGHRDEVLTGAFIDDDRKVITASSDGTIRQWDLKGKPIAYYKIGDLPTGLLPDTTLRKEGLEIKGNQVAVLKDGYEIFLTGHTNKVRSADFSPDRRYIVTAGEDGTARLWSDSGEQLHIFRFIETVTRAGFSPEGDSIVLILGEHSAVILPCRAVELIEMAEKLGIPDLSEQEKERLKIPGN
jgi:WD40 repeat protein